MDDRDRKTGTSCPDCHSNSCDRISGHFCLSEQLRYARLRVHGLSKRLVECESQLLKTEVERDWARRTLLVIASMNPRRTGPG